MYIYIVCTVCIHYYFCSNTTHVIFKNGLQSTYDKAKSWNIPIVSLLWIEACKKHMMLVDTKDYAITDLHRYENPELYDKIKVSIYTND